MNKQLWTISTHLGGQYIANMTEEDAELQRQLFVDGGLACPAGSKRLATAEEIEYYKDFIQ